MSALVLFPVYSHEGMHLLAIMMLLLTLKQGRRLLRGLLLEHVVQSSYCVAVQSCDDGVAPLRGLFLATFSHHPSITMNEGDGWSCEKEEETCFSANRSACRLASFSASVNHAFA